jgi:hypothetical protein
MQEAAAVVMTTPAKGAFGHAVPFRTGDRSSAWLQRTGRRVAALPGYGKNLTEIPATFLECRAIAARLLHHLKSGRVLILCATSIPAEVVLVSGAASSRA